MSEAQPFPGYDASPLSNPIQRWLAGSLCGRGTGTRRGRSAVTVEFAISNRRRTG